MRHSWEKRSHRTERSGRILMLLSDEDPMSGVSNLFDVAVVFIAAMFFIFASYLRQHSETASPDLRKALELRNYRESDLEASGEGEKLGAAYRLKNGDVVYVPETP